jgi:superfamily I DNA/RNA helicase
MSARRRILDDPLRIGTLHSILSHVFGLYGDGVFMTQKHEEEFCKSVGIQYAPYNHDEESFTISTSTSQSDWRRFVTWYEYIRNRMVKPYQSINEQMNLPYIFDRYVEWKEKHGLIDYSDILLAGLSGELPYVDILAVDEAQDMTPLMWKILDRWPTGKTIVALDDEQSIYSYMGVDQETTLDHVRNPDILKTCRRYGDPIRQVAERIVLPVRRIKRSYEAIGQSTVSKHSLKDFLTLDGSKAILCRTNYLAYKVAELLNIPAKSINPMHSLGIGWSPTTFELHDLLMSYPHLTLEQWQTLMKHTPASIWERGTKTKAIKGKLSLEYFDNMRKLDIQSLVPMINTTSKSKQNLIRWQGKKIDPVYIDTIHAAKGLEFDHVLVVLDYPPHLDFHANAEERRILYVGVTRARYSLDFFYFSVYSDLYDLQRIAA